MNKMYRTGAGRHKLCFGQKKIATAARVMSRTANATPTAMYIMYEGSSRGMTWDETSEPFELSEKIRRGISKSYNYVNFLGTGGAILLQRDIQ